MLFIGEAPGPSENIVGLPFIGPAGRLLDEMIDAALADNDLEKLPRGTFGRNLTKPTMAFTNLVMCIPLDSETLHKKGEPNKQEVDACYPRLEDFIKNVAKPKLIICVGALSTKQAETKGWNKLAKVVSIIHPSAILQQGMASKGLTIQRTIVQIGDALSNL